MDMHWLSNEAQQIHSLFSSLFFSLVLTLLLLGVVLGYFKMSMASVPDFLSLVGRAVIAAFLLVAFPEIMNTLAQITDQLSQEVGKLNNLSLVVSRLGEKIGDLSFSWVSVKDSVLLVVSYVSFFIVYTSVYLANALFIFTWLLLYIFSPFLIAAFVLPATSKATVVLFQSMIEVCLWKITWSVLAALLWSFALSQINKPEYGIDFTSAILINFMLAFSVVVTPLVVRGLMFAGVSSVSASLGGAILGVAALTPTSMASSVKNNVKRPLNYFKDEPTKDNRSNQNGRGNRGSRNGEVQKYPGTTED